MPVVSIILNSYNQRDYLAESVESVLSQSFGDFELLVLDNGSTDGSQELLETYRDPRVRLVLNADNQAISKRFNQGVELARGEFISFLYSDDFYLPGKLARQLEIFRRLPPDYGVVYGPGHGFNQLTGERWLYPSIDYSGLILRDMLAHYYRGLINMISPMTRRECFLRYRFHEDMFAEGEAVFFRVAMTYKFQYDAEPQVVMRDTGLNAGKAIKRNNEMTMLCLDRLAVHPDLPRDHADDVRRFRAALNRDHGWCMLRLDGDARWARGRFAEAIRLESREALHPRIVAGFPLSFCPPSLRHAVNQLGHYLRRRPGNGRLVDDYR
jgi:glycosyltransferase involved in cell wall biosynthesis